jgi:PAS domain-containing protein
MGARERALCVQRSCRELDELLTVTVLMNEPVLACDEHGQMVFANLAALQLFGEIDTERDFVDDCPETLGIFDHRGLRLLEPRELPLAQAAYEGRVVQRQLVVRQDDDASPVEATAFPVLDRLGRRVGAMMICRSLAAAPRHGRPQHWA